MYDLFISHASEDKATIARPLAETFRDRNWSVWYDDFELNVGDSLRERIDRGLADSRFGIVILSPAFFDKAWTRRELDGLTTRELGDVDHKVVLPVWHKVNKDDVAHFSPPLADRVAVMSSDGIPTVVEKIEYVLHTSANASVRRDNGKRPSEHREVRRRSLGIDGPIVIEPEVYLDERGFFVETFRADGWSALGIDAIFIQHNHSRSGRGTLRGMHFQAGAGQAKVVRCARGAILDVVVDIRRGSPTFGKWEALLLDEEKMQQLFIPIGFAHGFYVLSEVADVLYLCSTYYVPELERSLRWNDPDIAIAWPDDEVTISQRDAQAPLFRDLVDYF